MRAFDDDGPTTAVARRRGGPGLLRVKQVLVPNIQGQIDDVAALPRPDDEADGIDEFIARANEELDAVEEDPDVITGNRNPFARTSALAADLGLERCAS